MKIAELNQIDSILKNASPTQLIQMIEDGFIAYSQKEVVVAPVGHLGLENPSADVHIKYGYIKNDDYYVIKIASGFYENTKIGLSSSNGLMLAFNKHNGELEAILLDHGMLTDVRTALAGAVVAKHFAPREITKIGIVGTGVQAHLQLRFLASITPYRKAMVWGRSPEKVAEYIEEMKDSGFEIEAAPSLNHLAEECNFIITTTPSTSPLLMRSMIQPGTHITAVGADASGKQELDPLIVADAELVIADSIEQCIDHGEISHAISQGLRNQSDVLELGNAIHSKIQKQNQNSITVADLTGVAVQDIQITKFILEHL